MKNSRKAIFFIQIILVCLLVFSSADIVSADDYYTEGFFQYEITDEGIVIVSYYGPDKEVKIPDHIASLPVVCVKDTTFSGNETLTEVTIPDTVCKVDEALFKDTLGLKKVVLQSENISFAVPEGCIIEYDYPVYVDVNKGESTTEKDKTAGSQNQTEKDKTAGSQSGTEKDKTAGSESETEKDKITGSESTTEKDKTTGSELTTEKDKTSDNQENVGFEEVSENADSYADDMNGDSGENLVDSMNGEAGEKLAEGMNGEADNEKTEKNTSIKLILAAVMIIIVAGLYLLFKNRNKSQN